MKLSSMFTRAATLAGLATIVITGLPGAAGAAAPGATVSRFGDHLTVNANPGARNNASIHTFKGEIVVSDTASLVAGTGCRTISPRMVGCGTGITDFTVNLGDKDDIISVHSVFRGTIHGGDGNDRFLAGVQSGPARSRTFFGGPGVDTVSYRGSESFVAVSMDDNEADDGRNIDSDNIRTDVENLDGTFHGGDVLVGNSGNNEIIDPGGSNDRLIGLGGNDELIAKDTATENQLDCGPGANDKVIMDVSDPTPGGCEVVQKF